MENASKALLFAGGVLISIIIISMLVLMYNSLTSYQQVEVQNERESQIVQFNQQYEGYVRGDVRGNELYSLISKTIDYNNRESELVQGTDQFEPMTIKFTFAGKNIDNLKKGDSFLLFKDLNSNKSKVFEYKGFDKNNQFDYNNTFYNETIGEINKLPNKISVYLNKLNSNDDYKNGNTIISLEAFDRLVTAYDKIFYSDSYYNEMENTIKNHEKRVKAKAQIFQNFNSVVGTEIFKITQNDGTLKSENDLDQMWKRFQQCTIKEKVDTYYEYVQFKRAIFKCKEDKVKYSSTGRIIELEFEFTGKFN